MQSTGVAPRLSTRERDRRWSSLRSLMDGQSLEGVLVFGGGRDHWDRYVSNEALGGIAWLPRHGAPAYLLGKFPLERYDTVGEGLERWVEDFRVGDPASELPALLRERSLERVRLGVVGLSSRSLGSAPGTIPYVLWQRILASCPSAEFIDVSEQFEWLALIKGPEERELVRHAAQIGEAACEAFVSASRSGARESEIVAAALGATVARGGWTLAPTIIARSGPGAFSWSPPEWMHGGGGSRTVGGGDLVAAELFTCYGGFETQQQVQVSIGEPSRNVRWLVGLVEEAQQVAVSLLRPGALFSEVADAVRRVVIDAGCWNTGPVIQTVSPVMFNDATHENMRADPFLASLPRLPDPVPRDGDFTIEPGVAFAVQPNAIRDGDRICLGGTVLVTEDGIEELNDLPTRLHVV